VLVRDPLRPGLRTPEERLLPSGAHEVGANGRRYQANENGWIDFGTRVATLTAAAANPPPFASFKFVLKHVKPIRATAVANT
jgi:hypothetical protein